MDKKTILGNDFSENTNELLSDKSMDKKAVKERCRQVFGALKPDYDQYTPIWKGLAEYSNSFRGKFIGENRFDFLKRSDKIIDNTLGKSLNILAAGLQSGLTNQTTRWFKFGLQDTDLMNWQAVRVWLREVEDIIFAILARGNFYKLTPLLYKELGLFGQPCLFQSESPKYISEFADFTCGEYMLGSDGSGVINLFCRYFAMSATQLVERFGFDNVNQKVKDAYKSANINSTYNVIHVIMPNMMMNKGKIDNKNKAFISVYYLESSDDDELLSLGGYDSLPVHTPRWETLSNEPYGISAAMNAFGLTKSLQKWHETRHFAADMMAKPPLNVPKSMFDDGYKPSLVPGGINLYEDRFGAGAATSAINVNMDINAVREIIAESRVDIMEAMFADVFKMIANTAKTMTAAEVMERQEEKMLLLGPVLNNAITELLNPVLNQVLFHAMKFGILPPPPEELQGHELKIEYLSVLAQAQKMIENRANQEFIGYVGSMAQFSPNALKKLNVNSAIDDFADKRGVNPKLVVSNEDVEDEIAAESQQMEQARQMQQAEQALKGAESLVNIQKESGMI